MLGYLESRSKLLMKDEGIDVVYTWVNHADPDWRRLYTYYRKQVDDDSAVDETAVDEARFSNRDELTYSLRSLRRHASWVRNIFVVTNCALPEWAVGEMNAIKVSHEEIFSDSSALPTFNSHAIEANLHRIRGLSEKFIYFNDDVFLCSDVEPSDFYNVKGFPKIVLSPHPIPNADSASLLPVDHAAINVRNLLEKEFSFLATNKLQHAPFALLKSTLFEIEERYREQLSETSMHRFRHETDLPLATTLHAYYSIATGRGEYGSLKCRYINIGEPAFVFLINRFSPLRRGAYQAFCLNEVRSISRFGGLRDAIVRRFLENMFDG